MAQKKGKGKGDLKLALKGSEGLIRCTKEGNFCLGPKLSHRGQAREV